MQEIYEPREDSLLLQKYVRKCAHGVVLDMGTGSGIQAITAAKRAKMVIAVDIDPKEGELLKKNPSIKFYRSDLFSALKAKQMKFDTIIFNPPYLPEDLQVKDLTLDGGRKGYEILERFLNEVNRYLQPKGIVLIVFSSLTSKPKVDEFIANNMLEYKELERKHIFFEDLYVYLIKKSDLLQRLEKTDFKAIKYFARGKRGIVFTGFLRGKKLAIKTKRPESGAVGRIANEAKCLRILNKKGIGPRLLMAGKEYLVYEFVEGEFFAVWIAHGKKAEIRKVIRGVFEQLFTMDKMKLNKEEMSHPRKHILVNKKKVVLIDFERCHGTAKPSNVTQFCSFLMSNHVSSMLRSRGIAGNRRRIIELSRRYKEHMTKDELHRVVKEIIGR